MSRITPVDPSGATGTTAELLAAARPMFGGTPNLVTTAANAPSTLDAMLGLFRSTGKSSLGPKRGELVAIAVAQANGCGYCLSAHTTFGKMYGLDGPALSDARDAVAADPKTDALLKLAVAIINTRGHISDATLAAARTHSVTDAEVMEIVAHVALNVFTNYLNNVSATAIDFPLVPLEQAA